MSIKNELFHNLKADIPASLVVFLVALPLCLGIALASGAPLFSGVIAGIIGGLVVASLSGSALGVSGPAAGLAVIVMSAIASLGSFEVFLLAVVIGGVFQILLGILKAGVIAYYFPSAVIKGMLAGIGIIIALKQIPHAVGYDADAEGDFAFYQTDGHNTFSELYYMLDHINHGAVFITVVALMILIVWESAFVKKSFLKLIPGPLIAVISGILLNLSFQGIPGYMLSEEQTVNIPIAAGLGDFLSQFTFPDFSQLWNPEVYLVGITIAVVASLETLLCVEATDKLDPERRVTPTNRELFAQGTGNILSGLIGGLPITQVIVRSSANIQSGGKTKISAILHGLMLLVTVMLIPHILNLIPLASLAAVLFVVGYKLAQPSLFIEMYKKGKDHMIPFMVTILGIIFTDLLIGITLGLVVGVFEILYNNFKTPYHFDPASYKPGKPIYIEMSQEVTFLHKAQIQQTLSHLPDDSHVIVDASRTKYMHDDVEEILSDFEKNARSRGIVFEWVREPFDESVEDRRKHALRKFTRVVEGKNRKLRRKPLSTYFFNF
jgi:MFS superfamily sulfate permease-like transporter